MKLNKISNFQTINQNLKFQSKKNQKPNEKSSDMSNHQPEQKPQTAPKEAIAQDAYLNALKVFYTDYPAALKPIISIKAQDIKKNSADELDFAEKIEAQTPLIIKKGNAQIRDAKAVFEEGMEKYQKALELIEQTTFSSSRDDEEQSSKIIEKKLIDGREVEFELTLTDGEYTPSKMLEYDEEGNLLREVQIEDFAPSSITEYDPETSKKNIFLYQRGGYLTLCEAKIGNISFKNKSETDKIYKWKEGDLSEILIQNKEFLSGLKTSRERYKRLYGALASYSTDCIKTGDNAEKFASQTFNFDGNSISSYEQFARSNHPICENVHKRFEWGEFGNLSCYKSYQKHGNSEQSDIKYIWDNGVLSKYFKGYEKNRYNVESFKQKYEWQKGELSSYVENTSTNINFE